MRSSDQSLQRSEESGKLSRFRAALGEPDEHGWYVIPQDSLINAIQKHVNAGMCQKRLNDFWNEFCHRYEIECDVRSWNYTIGLRFKAPMLDKAPCSQSQSTPQLRTIKALPVDK
jgi:hypothetical protein